MRPPESANKIRRSTDGRHRWPPAPPGKMNRIDGCVFRDGDGAPSREDEQRDDPCSDGLNVGYGNRMANLGARFDAAVDERAALVRTEVRKSSLWGSDC